MQKPIGGRSVLAFFATNSMLKTEADLFAAYLKGGIVSERVNAPE